MLSPWPIQFGFKSLCSRIWAEPWPGPGGRWCNQIMHLDSLLLWWAAQWCLWDFLPNSGSYNHQFVPEPHKGNGARDEINAMELSSRKQREYLCFLFRLLEFQMFYFLFSSASEQRDETKKTPSSVQEGHPGIKLLACRGTLASSDILFRCLHFLYLPFFYLLSFPFAFKEHPAFPSHNHKRLSLIIPWHVSVQREYFGLLASGCSEKSS